MDAVVEKRTCHHCQNPFEITTWDIAFYKKIDVPPPTFCPDCRFQRRTAQVNQIYLFKRTCDATKRSILSNYPASGPYTVYCQPYWVSDEYDGTAYGRPFDFSRPFFEQYAELSLLVPRPALFTDYLHDENCEYTNYAGKNKNCYLLFDSDENWDCYYGYGVNSSRSSLDCYRVQRLELCYETVDSIQCYNCLFTTNSENCNDCVFINNCIGCQNCIMCCNLQHKKYWINNAPATKQAFEELKARCGSFAALSQQKKAFQDFSRRFPQRYMRGTHNENVSGDHLVHSKNAAYCFDSMNLWDAKYCVQTFIQGKNMMDCSECGDGELIYESSNSGYNAYNLRFSFHCLSQVTNLTYCNYCKYGCHDLFGCVGLKRKAHCLLNRQYSKNEYEALVKRIIAHMKETGEWGEFFPASISAFPYNLTVAYEYFPLSKEQVIASGLQWFERDGFESHVATAELPENISDAPASLLQGVFVCENCGKNYRFIAQELALYEKHHIALPRNCFHCRHMERIAVRNKRRLWTRMCDKCKASFFTSYAPDQPDIVYCEKCYLESLT